MFNTAILRAYILADLFTHVITAFTYSFIGEEEKALASALIVTGCYILDKRFFSKEMEDK